MEKYLIDTIGILAKANSSSKLKAILSIEKNLLTIYRICNTQKDENKKKVLGRICDNSNRLVQIYQNWDNSSAMAKELIEEEKKLAKNYDLLNSLK